MKKTLLITFTAFSLFINAQSALKNTPNSQASTNAINLIACYDLNNGTAVDAIGALNGTATSVTSVTGQNTLPNSATQFSGVAASKILLPVSSTLKPQQLAMSMWIKTTTTNNQYIVFHKNGLTSNFEGAVIAISSNKIKAIKNKNNSTSFVVSDLNNVPTNTWVHVAADFGDNLRLWINGVLVGASSGSGGIDYDAGKGFVLGGSSETFNLPFAGVIDNLVFYNTDISSDIATIYADSSPCHPSTPGTAITCYDLANASANDATTTLNGTATGVTSIDGFNATLNGATQFAGTGASKITLPVSATLRPQYLSMSMWLKTTSASNQYVVFHKNANSANFEGAAIVISGGKITAVKNKNSGSGFSIADPTSLPLNTWTHVAASFGETLTLWVNGVAVASTGNTGIVDYSTTTGFVLGGSDQTFNIPFTGAIDNLVLYDGNIFTYIADIYANTDPCNSPTGLEDGKLGKNRVTLFPNPANTNVTLRLTNEEKHAALEIIDITGKVLKEQIIIGNEIQLDIADLSGGIYFVKVKAESGLIISKLVKE